MRRFFAAAALAALLTAPVAGFALDEHYSAFACHSDGKPWNTEAYYGSIQQVIGSLGVLYCQIDSDDRFPATDINLLEVYVASDSVDPTCAHVCKAYTGTTGGACGYSTCSNPTAPGSESTLSPSLTIFHPGPTGLAFVPYLMVIFPQVADSEDYNLVHGYFTSN